MTEKQPVERMTARQMLAFYAKVFGMLIAFAAFGVVIYLLTRSLHVSPR